MRDMRDKFGAEVKTFPYAFVLAKHFPGWENLPLAKPIGSNESNEFPAFAIITQGKAPKYIVVKSRT